MQSAKPGKMVSEGVLDEVWLMMHMAAEVGAHNFPKSYSQQKFVFEAEVEPDFLNETTENDDNEGAEEIDKEKALINVAETLMQMGDELNKERDREEEVKRLSNEIAEHIKEVVIPNIEEKLSPKLCRASATSIFSQHGVLETIYQMFKTKVEQFVGSTQDMNHMALVTHITRGVASGLKGSTSGMAGLLATVSTIYVEEKFSSLLKGKPTLTNIVPKSKD